MPKMLILGVNRVASGMEIPVVNARQPSGPGRRELQLIVSPKPVWWCDRIRSRSKSLVTSALHLGGRYILGRSYKLF